MVDKQADRPDKQGYSWLYVAEDKMFVLSLHAGLEGYHVNVDGKHARYLFSLSNSEYS